MLLIWKVWMVLLLKSTVQMKQLFIWLVILQQMIMKKFQIINNATIPPNSIRGSLNNKFDSPAMADPIIKPTIKILKDNKIILNDNRLLIRSKRCKKEGASSTFKLNFKRPFCIVFVVS